MATPDLDVIKDIPGYKVILKAVVRSQIQTLVEQLAAHTDEESVILTASVADGTLSHIGSESGKSFLEDHEDVKSQFLGFCLKYHHRKKQEEKEKERERQQQLEQEKMQQMMQAASIPNPHFMASRSPQHFSPRYTSPRQRPPLRSPGMRHEPYRGARPIRRPVPLNLEQGGLVVRRPANLDGQIIKIEQGDSDEASNQSASDSNPAAVNAATSSSPSQNITHSTPSNMKSDRDDDADAHSESSTGTIPHTPVEGLSLDSDLSNLITARQGSDMGAGGDDASETETSAGLLPDASVKLEALTESEMELEITGVEPGRLRPMLPMPQDNWGGVNVSAAGMSYDPTGATGSPGDVSQQGYNQNWSTQPSSSREKSEPFYSQPYGSQLPVNSEHSAYKFSCKYCGKGFKNGWLLERHVRIHTGEKPFGCPVCSKKFNDKSAVKKHVFVVHASPVDNKVSFPPRK